LIFEANIVVAAETHADKMCLVPGKKNIIFDLRMQPAHQQTFNLASNLTP
jgi:hypothetical protein